MAMYAEEEIKIINNEPHILTKPLEDMFRRKKVSLTDLVSANIIENNMKLASFWTCLRDKFMEVLLGLPLERSFYRSLFKIKRAEIKPYSAENLGIADLLSDMNFPANCVKNYLICDEKVKFYCSML
jgi:hypothetical protein